MLSDNDNNPLQSGFEEQEIEYNISYDLDRVIKTYTARAYPMLAKDAYEIECKYGNVNVYIQGWMLTGRGWKPGTDEGVKGFFAYCTGPYLFAAEDEIVYVDLSTELARLRKRRMDADKKYRWLKAFISGKEEK